MGKRFELGSLSLQAGVLILLLGLQLRAVETFELSAPTTRILAGFVGPSPRSPHGAVRQLVIDTAQPRHRLTAAQLARLEHGLRWLRAHGAWFVAPEIEKN